MEIDKKHGEKERHNKDQSRAQTFDFEIIVYVPQPCNSQGILDLVLNISHFNAVLQCLLASRVISINKSTGPDSVSDIPSIKVL